MTPGMPAPAPMQPGQMSMQTGMPPGTLQPSLQAGQPAGGQVNFAPAPMSQANAKQMSGQGETGSLVNGRKKYEFPMKPNEFIDVFPTLFTIFIMALFIIPIWLTYSVGRDGQVRYWIGSYCSTVLLLPICYLILHVVHLYQARPSKPGMIICLLGSCFLLLLVADYTLLEAYGLGNLLMSKDCVSFEHKRVLQEEWLSAKAFYNSCMQATAAKSGITFDAAVSLYRIEDCLEYENLKASYPDWEYFAKLEETYSCSGWCTHDQPLWTFKAVKDSCSQVVADVMFNKVEWGMTQVVVYTILALGFTAVFLLAAGPIFQSTGISW